MSNDVAYADLAVRVVLSEVGRSIRSRQPRTMRGKEGPYQNLERWQWHTVTPLEELQSMPMDRMIGGAFDPVDQAAPSDPCLRGALETYVRVTVIAQIPHDTAKLTRHLRDSGCLPDSDTA